MERCSISDTRAGEEGLEEVYQTAREGDVEPLSLGGQLFVRTRSRDEPLLQRLASRTDVFTPNGDGVNDAFEVAFNLLKIQKPGRYFSRSSTCREEGCGRATPASMPAASSRGFGTETMI